MTIDKFLVPRKETTATVSFDVVDTSLGETARYEAVYALASSSEFRLANVKAQRAVLGGTLLPENGEAFILNECFVSGSINGEEITQEQNASFMERYPDLIGKVDIEISRGSAFIKPVLTGSKSTQSDHSGSVKKSTRNRK